MFGLCQGCPNYRLAGSFGLNLMAIQTKTAALVVFFQPIFIAINAEQNLLVREIEIF